MTSQPSSIPQNAVRFVDKLAGSTAFKSLFKEGMALVEETAAYLDGKGREDARHLPRTAALSYASESMRLTTRLMQIASWLLLQRAVNEGEITQAEAASDKRRSRISWQTTPRTADGTRDLPGPLLTLIETSLRLQERIVRLDSLISDVSAPLAVEAGIPPIDAQMARLRTAFPGA